MEHRHHLVLDNEKVALGVCEDCQGLLPGGIRYFPNVEMCNRYYEIRPEYILCAEIAAELNAEIAKEE